MTVNGLQVTGCCPFMTSREAHTCTSESTHQPCQPRRNERTPCRAAVPVMGSLCGPLWSWGYCDRPGCASEGRGLPGSRIHLPYGATIPPKSNAAANPAMAIIPHAN